jgi:hypothetical protein
MEDPVVAVLALDAKGSSLFHVGSLNSSLPAMR